MKIQKARTKALLAFYFFTFLFIFLTSIGYFGCKKPTKPDVELELDPATNNLTVDLNTSAPPNTTPKAQPDFDFFAWNTFIALNWPAVKPESANNFQRGIPDTKQKFIDGKNNTLTVWETFKEKREVFNQDGKDPGPWNADLNYGPLRGADTDTTPALRTFHQSRKMMTSSFNSLDETAEVGSEALETTYPDGSPNPVVNRPVGPRVWRGMPQDATPVLYEVKVNYDFYNYVRQNDLFIKNVGFTEINNKADSGLINLPYRTSSKASPGGSTKSPENHKIILNYSAEGLAKTYQNYQNRSNQKDTILPPGIGSMHLKAAWIKLDPTKDDITKYHTSNAQYFVTNPTTGKPEVRQGTFGLIGLHIIQRIHTSTPDSTKANPLGGTFIFATWEHTSLDTTKYTYSNYYNPVVDPACGGGLRPPDKDCPNYPNKLTPHGEGFYPPLNQPYTVQRLYQPISQKAPKPMGTVEVNAVVHQAIKDALKAEGKDTNSVWLNYRLIGTQFKAIDLDTKYDPDDPRYPVTEYDPTGIGQPIYLANLVIETNHGLQKFMGQPPVTQVISKYSKKGLVSNNGYNYVRNTPNLAFMNFAAGAKPVNMGGCMGCHGVAQSKGYSFSFVLLGGYQDALTDTETHFEIPPLQPVIQ